jgi:lipopolysaccharide/colanic/teichoic acid biosynthesis glycosyltransferase
MSLNSKQQSASSILNPNMIWFRELKKWYEIDPRRIGDRQVYLIIKRAMDLGFVLVALPFVFPLLALLIILIKLDSPGPAWFIQKRTGRGGKRFNMLKLRTMVVNAEELKETYMHLNELEWPDFKITNDPRITRVGKVLRKTSLDELPQLFNILKGEMSLVGPRPTSFSTQMYRIWHTRRLELKPGLTGLWQVVARNESNFNERLRLDIAYMKNQSLLLDLRILYRTIGSVFNAKGV